MDSKIERKQKKIDLYKKELFEVADYPTIYLELLESIVDYLGGSIYDRDAELVASSDPSELRTVRENFLKKKLGLSLSNGELDNAINEVVEILGKSNRNKYRVVVYYMLAIKFNKTKLFV